MSSGEIKKTTGVISRPGPALIARPSSPLPKDIGLRSNSFSLANLDGLKRRVIANVEGGPKVGKTDFCLRHSPDPIVIFNFDQGLEWVVEKIRRETGKMIFVAGVPGSEQKGYRSYHFARPVPQEGEKRKDRPYLTRVSAQASPIWERFISDLDEFYHSGARTGVVDTGKAAFALGKFAYLGMDVVKVGADDPYGQKSGNLNAVFQGLITDGYNYDKNMLWVHRIKEEWVGGEPSGKWKTAGYNEVNYEVQLTIRLNKRPPKKRGEEVVRTAEIRDCRIDENMNGEVFEGRMVEFPTIMGLVTGTDEEEWV